MRYGPFREQVELLIDDAYPFLLGFPRMCKRNFSAIQIDFSRIWNISPRHYLHQCGFPGAVLPHDGMNLSRKELEGDIVQSNNTREPFGNILNFHGWLNIPRILRTGLINFVCHISTSSLMIADQASKFCRNCSPCEAIASWLGAISLQMQTARAISFTCEVKDSITIAP